MKFISSRDQQQRERDPLRSVAICEVDKKCAI